MKELKFVKMHGTGNDFIMLDANDIKDIGERLDKNIITKMCDRHFGIGSDGVIIRESGEKTKFRYIMYNPDGSEAEMCGNGIRCFMKFLQEKGHTKRENIRVETGAGILSIHTDGDMVSVSMGKPKIITNKYQNIDRRQVYGTILAHDKLFKFIPISMGNPHAVIYLQRSNLSELDIDKYGEKISSDIDIFPNKTNVEFVKYISDTQVQVRTYERGAAETLACGTGACAVVVGGILSGQLQTNEFIQVQLKGGDLSIKWSGDWKDQVIMKGPAEMVYSGTYFID